MSIKFINRPASIVGFIMGLILMVDTSAFYNKFYEWHLVSYLDGTDKVIICLLQQLFISDLIFEGYIFPQKINFFMFIALRWIFYPVISSVEGVPRNYSRKSMPRFKPLLFKCLIIYSVSPMVSITIYFNVQFSSYLTKQLFILISLYTLLYLKYTLDSQKNRWIFDGSVVIYINLHHVYGN